MRKGILCISQPFTLSLQEEKYHFEIGNFAQNSKFIFSSMEIVMYFYVNTVI